MDKFWVVLGVVVIALGMAVIFTAHSLWGLRGLGEIALGGYLIYTGLEELNG